MEAEETEKEIEARSNEYRPVAKRASLLYFCLADLAVVSVITPHYLGRRFSDNVAGLFPPSQEVLASPSTLRSVMSGTSVPHLYTGCLLYLAENICICDSTHFPFPLPQI